MTVLGAWILRLAGAAIISAAAIAITPDGAVKKVVSVLCGILTLTTMLSIGADFDFTAFSQNLAVYREKAEENADEMSNNTYELSRIIIEDECGAYILDKGRSLGANDMEVHVSAKWSDDGYWYPYKASIVCDAEENLRKQIIYYIETELGIPEKEQYWRAGDE